MGRSKTAVGLSVLEAQNEGCSKALRSLLGERRSLPERRFKGEALALGICEAALLDDSEAKLLGESKSSVRSTLEL